MICACILSIRRKQNGLLENERPDRNAAERPARSRRQLLRLSAPPDSAGGTRAAATSTATGAATLSFNERLLGSAGALGLAAVRRLDSAGAMDYEPLPGGTRPAEPGRSRRVQTTSLQQRSLSRQLP